MSRPPVQDPPLTATPAIFSLPMEERVQLAVKDWKAGGQFDTRRAVAQYYSISPRKLYNRLKGIKPGSEVRRGNRSLTAEEELAFVAWISLHISAGVEISSAKAAKSATILIESNGRHGEVCARWARRWLGRHPHLCHTTRTKSLAVMRKAAMNAVDIPGYFTAFKEILEKEAILPLNGWNADDSGSRVGMLLKKLWAWTYPEIETAVMNNPEARKLVSVVESISRAGNPDSPFVILPVTHLAQEYINDNLEDEEQAHSFESPDQPLNPNYRTIGTQTYLQN